MKFDLQTEKKAFILNVQFSETESYKSEDNICDYMVIDSSNVFSLACINAKQNISYFIGLDGINSFLDLSNRDKKLKKVVKNINKERPELMLFCRNLCGRPFYIFMYVKNNKIYVYRVPDGQKMELNEYIRTFYSIESIRKLNRIPIRVTDRTKDSISYRIAGHTSSQQIQIS